MLDIDALNAEFEGKTAEDLLQWGFDHFDASRIVLSTSFGAEGVALIHMLVNLRRIPRVFTIDTGRHFPETYAIWDEVVRRYGIAIESYSPDPDELSRLLAGRGPNLFYDSVESRKACCHVRKVRPLARALAGAELWISALRREQGESRRRLPHLDYSEQYRLHKLYPLASWLEDNVWAYVRNNGVPYSRLYDQGFLTIGCAPCTRPVRPAEGPRAARWWWERDEQKECGIHLEEGRVVRQRRPADYQI